VLNYRSQILNMFDHLTSLIDEAFQPEEAGNIKQIVRDVKEATVFELPQNGQFIEGQNLYDLMEDDLFNMPFPSTLFEFPFDDIYFKPGTNTTVSSKRAVLILDSQQLEHHPTIKQVLRQRPELTHPDHPGFLMVLPISYMDADCSFKEEILSPEFLEMTGDAKGAWTPSPVWAVIEKVTKGEDLKQQHERQAQQQDLGPNAVILPFFVRLYPVASSLFEHYMEQDEEAFEEAHRHMLSDVTDEVVALCNFLVTLSCTNVKTHKQAAPAKLNKKRARTGKHLIPEIHTLVIINTQPSTNARVNQQTENYRDRVSPKAHLRRGHIRRLLTGKRTWVRPSMIGSIPKVQSTYILW